MERVARPVQWSVADSTENKNTDTQVLSTEQIQNISVQNEECICAANDLPSKADAIRYLHTSFGFPTKSAILRAARMGFLTSWPGLTVNAINKHFPESVETQKGHMRHQRKGMRSTKQSVLQANVSEEDEAELEQLIKQLKLKQRDLYITILEKKEVIYTDQTRKFPHTSSRGNKYIMVLYYMDGSHIMMEPMKSKEEAEMICVHVILIQCLKKTGVAPTKQILDNEISKGYEKAIKKHGMKAECMPKDAHHRNVAEKAIQIAKCHLKAILAGCDASFPMHLWDRLLPQAEIQINLLRPANANPNVSAHQYLHGNFDYNNTPLHPLGCAAQAFNSLNTRKSWEEQSKMAGMSVPAKSTTGPTTSESSSLELCKIATLCF